jgi:AcrR family transcriptional regulator
VSTSEPVQPRSDYHHGDLRRALVAAALELVAGEGAEALSLREVARRARVSHNAPYRHFPSRAALLAAVAAAGFEALAATLAAVGERGTAAARLRALGKAYIAFATENGALYRLMFGGAIEPSADAALAEAAERAFEPLRRAVAAIEPQAPLREATLSAWAFVHGLAHLALDRQLAEDVDRDRLVEIGTRIFDAGLAAIEIV